ncbi:hypothetical protein, partial [Salmonella enterica]|uniref:hypothetical protein n=1 Tax=Salmonella enterica TaxID=28901 RepID=UPI001C99B483
LYMSYSSLIMTICQSTKLLKGIYFQEKMRITGATALSDAAAISSGGLSFEVISMTINPTKD